MRSLDHGVRMKVSPLTILLCLSCSANHRSSFRLVAFVAFLTAGGMLSAPLREGSPWSTSTWAQLRRCVSIGTRSILYSLSGAHVQSQAFVHLCIERSLYFDCVSARNAQVTKFVQRSCREQSRVTRIPNIDSL